MTAAASDERLLTAVDVLHPGPGELVRVIEGEVLLFALEPAGRRVPLATVSAGGIVVGCAPAAEGARLLVTGLPGARVRVGALDDTAPLPDLVRWVGVLAAAVADGRLPGRPLGLSEATGTLAPGEQVVAEPSERGALVWARVTSGSALLCDAPGASIGPLDPPVPLGEGGWLTAGLRCRVGEVAGPSTPAGWAEPLSLLGAVATQALIHSRRREDLSSLDRLRSRGAQSSTATQESVDLLAAAVGGDLHIPLGADGEMSDEMAVALRVARASAFDVDEQAVMRAASEVAAGRDPVMAVAGACGARPRVVTLEPGWQRREGSPLIASVREQGRATRRPTALVWRGGAWAVIDPRSGEEAAASGDLLDQVDPRARELVPQLPDRPSTLRDLLRLGLRGSGRDLALVAAATGLIAVLSFATPFLLGRLAGLFASFAPASAYVAVFAALLLVILAGALWQGVRAVALLRTRARGSSLAFAGLWERIMRQRATWHGERALGDRMAQASALNTASAALPDETIARLLDVSIIVGGLAAVATTSGSLAVALAVLIGVQVAITWGLLRVTALRATERIDASAAASGRLLEILKAVNRLKVAGAESRAFLRWSESQSRFARADQSLRSVTMAQGVVIAVWPLLTLAVIVAVTASSGASFAAFITAQTAASMAGVAVASASVAASAGLIARRTLAKAEPALATVPEGGLDGIQPGMISGGIEAQDLIFRYAPELPPVLNGVSVTVAPGEHVAIVGPSGCGKTTLMRIILGLEEPDSGVILVDGRDLASLDRSAVRRQVGSVLQSSQLLPGMIRTNVDMGRGLTSTEIWAALDAASIGDDVRRMPMGLDTPVTEGGGTLSGGQRQRVLIARALAGEPRVLVLDEATSALDNLTQAAVVESLESLRITRVVVAHRLSTIRHADRIIVLDAGSVVDEGTYDELMSREGAFRELALRQQA